MLRMVYDEPVRFKLVQLVGNLSLLNVAGCQGIPVGHVTAFNATPSLQLAFVRALLESIDEPDVLPVNTVLELQEAWVQERTWSPRGSTSQGPSDLNDDGMPATVEDGLPAAVDAEVMGDDEDL